MDFVLCSEYNNKVVFAQIWEDSERIVKMRSEYSRRECGVTFSVLGNFPGFSLGLYIIALFCLFHSQDTY